jgi:manganese/zinc/iron transport system permease protein
MDWTYTLRNVLIGASLLGVLGGVIGCFAFLRRQSLLGDALAHAALPGVCLAFLLTGSKDPMALLVGAMLAGVAGALAILGVVRGSRIKEDAAMGIILSVFFGVGIVLLTWIQKLPSGNQSGLDHFLFGQAATIGEDDVVLMGVVGVVVLGAVALLFKEFKLISFDRAFGASLGFPIRGLEIVLTSLLVVVVVIGLRTVGVVLMVATLLNPAAAARQWTDRLGRMLILAGAIGGFSGAAGALASATVERLPTGPSIVIVSSAILVVSILLAPRRGILWSAARARVAERRIRRENLLKDLYSIAERSGDFHRMVPLPVLMGVRGQTGGRILRSARRLAEDGLVERSADSFRLSVEGRAAAERVVRNHRLWELYLARRLELPSDHVHRDAEAMEHALSDEAAAELDRLLGHPETDPHGRTIPRPATSAGGVSP